MINDNYGSTNLTLYDGIMIIILGCSGDILTRYY